MTARKDQYVLSNGTYGATETRNKKGWCHSVYKV